MVKEKTRQGGVGLRRSDEPKLGDALRRRHVHRYPSWGLLVVRRRETPPPFVTDGPF